MGKYPNSDIHAKYSDWHWQLGGIDEKYRRLYVSDIDRLWHEYDFKSNSVVAIIDLKWEDSGDGMTPTEKAIYDWYKKIGANYYIVFIARDFSRFRVVNSSGMEKIFKPLEYADWLLSLREKRNEYWPLA
jgi:hypothetical protein